MLSMYYLFILAVGIQRLIELVVSRRKAAWSIAQGGKEFGRGHYPAGWRRTHCYSNPAAWSKSGHCTDAPPVAGLADAARRGAQHRHAWGAQPNWANIGTPERLASPDGPSWVRSGTTSKIRSMYSTLNYVAVVAEVSGASQCIRMAHAMPSRTADAAMC